MGTYHDRYRSLSQLFVQKVEIQTNGMVNFISASGPSYRYHIGIIFPLKLSHTTTINDSNVYTKFDETALVYEIANAIPIQNQGIDMLIGMDIIRMGNLSTNNDYFSFEMSSSRLIVEKPITSQNSAGEQKTKQE